MTFAPRRRRAPGYDLFKLVVAMILAILFVLLMLPGSHIVPMFLREPPPAPLASPTAILPRPTQTVATADPSLAATVTGQPSRTSAPPYPTHSGPSAPGTMTTMPSLTPSPQETPEDEPTHAPTLAPTPALTPTPIVIHTPVEPPPPPDANACPSASTRIQNGDSLRVLVRLNFRTGPGLTWPIIQTNKPGTPLQVIGGPTCTRLSAPDGPAKAYLWWNVRMEDSRQGWSAEGSLNGLYYFLEPGD